MKPPVALTIAGSDSGGGAGIQADLKTFFALGVHGTSAISAVTAQNTLGVSQIHSVPSNLVSEQIRQVVADFEVSATKTGMLGNAAIVRAVCEAARELGLNNLVVDPVMICSSGDPLLSPEGIDALIMLLPLATVVTPNLAEAARLTALPVGDIAQMRRAARVLNEMGAARVLVKGGHLEGDAVDLLFDGAQFYEYRAPRVVSGSTHGTGCTLSAAIAALLAKGMPLPAAVGRAKEFVTGAIRNGLELGRGAALTNHGWSGF